MTRENDFAAQAAKLKLETRAWYNTNFNMRWFLVPALLSIIALLDVMMAGMDGFEVCEKIRLDPKLAEIPIVMVTALSETADIERATECGTDDYLTKPIERAALVNLVRAMLQNRVRK